MARKRTTLPKEFDQLLETGDLDALIAVFDTCEIEARGGYSKSTALGFVDCPDELARWLVAHGADVNSRDTYQRTPLHARAARFHTSLAPLVELGADLRAADYEGQTPLHAAAQAHIPTAVDELIRLGADVAATGRRGATALETTLTTASNIDLARTAEIVELLLAAGARISPAARDSVTRLGTDFEFYRSGFASDLIDETEAGLQRLYELTGVAPVAPIRKHDGQSPIVVEATEWKAQHAELWDYLVPPSGPALTAQAEVIRLSGRIGHELLDNGGGNWDADFTRMLEALAAHLASHNALDAATMDWVTQAVQALRGGAVIEGWIDGLSQLSVRWVLANPQPIPLAPVTYKR